MKARNGVNNASERASRPPGRPAVFNRFMVGVNIEQEYLFKMRELNRSELINSLLKKHFDAEGDQQTGGYISEMATNQGLNVQLSADVSQFVASLQAAIASAQAAASRLFSAYRDKY